MAEKHSSSQGRRKQRGGRIILPALCNVVGTVIILLVITLLLPATLSRALGYEVYNVVSGSMEPSIPVGSMVFVKPMDWREINSGDVIAFYSGSSVTTHRVVESHMYEREFITKGDANENEDLSAVPYGNLIGRVERHIPYVGEITALAASLVGKLYLFAFLLCGFLFNVLAGRLRES